MKNLLLSVALLTGFCMPVYPQEADMRTGELMNNSDWFALNEEYPLLKEKIQWQPLKYMAEIMLGYYFNRPEEALEGINVLLSNHQEEIGFPNVYSFVSLAAVIHGRQGRYAQCADMARGFVDQLQAQGVSEGLESMEVLYKTYNALRDIPAPEFNRIGKDIEVPFTLKQERRGVHMYVPVVVNGREHQFIFDTGAASTYIKQRFAEEAGIRILNDSVMINEGTIGESYGMTGLFEELSMASGDISVKNVVAAIARPDETVDTAFTADAVLGLDFMMPAGEVHILPQENKIVFPVGKTPLPPSGPNLMFVGNLLLKAYSGDERLVLWFDTGNVRTEMLSKYYEKHKDRIDSEGVKDVVWMGGHGFAKDFDVYKLPELPLGVGDAGFKLNDVMVVPEPGLAYEMLDGNLGMDFFMVCSRVIINFEDMFVKVEF